MNTENSILEISGMCRTCRTGGQNCTSHTHNYGPKIHVSASQFWDCGHGRRRNTGLAVGSVLIFTLKLVKFLKKYQFLGLNSGLQARKLNLKKNVCQHLDLWVSKFMLQTWILEIKIKYFGSIYFSTVISHQIVLGFVPTAAKVVLRWYRKPCFCRYQKLIRYVKTGPTCEVYLSNLVLLGRPIWNNI